MMKLLPDIDQAYNLILQEEKQRSLTAMSQFISGSSTFNVNFMIILSILHLQLNKDRAIQGFSKEQLNNSGTNFGHHQGNAGYNSNSTYKGTTRFGNQDR